VVISERSLHQRGVKGTDVAHHDDRVKHLDPRQKLRDRGGIDNRDEKSGLSLPSHSPPIVNRRALRGSKHDEVLGKRGMYVHELCLKCVVVSKQTGNESID